MAAETKWGTVDLFGEGDGYVESVSVSYASETADVKDKDGKIKAKAFFGLKREATITVITKGAVKVIGDTITIDGKSFVVTSVEESGSNSDFVKSTIKAVSYGENGNLTPDTEP